MTFVDPALTVPDIAGRDISDPICEGSAMRDEARFSEPIVTYTYDANGPYAPTLSDQALELVNGERAEEYAPPEVNMPRIGQMWAGMLGLEKPIPGWRVALMLAGLKLVRAAHKPGDDSLVDAVGYVEIANRLRPSGDSMWIGEGLVSRG